MPDSEGQAPRINLRCTACGYGVLVRAAPERCPMCGGASWEHADPELLGRLLQARVRGEAPDVRSLFRHLNEELAAVAAGDDLELVCECGDGRCFAAVGLARDDFRALAASPGHHLVLPGHEAAGEEKVAAGRRFVIAAEPVADLAPAAGHGRPGRVRPRQ